MLSILDCNNFWSPSGGGVRRYHLEKLAFFTGLSDARYTFLMPDDHTRTEVLNETTTIEHVRAPKIWGQWEYRYLMRSAPVLAVLEKHQPHVVEVGSPYVMPWLLRKARKSLPGNSSRGKALDERSLDELKTTSPKLISPKLVAFWHADYPVTYVHRFFAKYNAPLARVMESLAWRHARLTYKGFSGFFVSSRVVGDRMARNGLGPIHRVPLGVDIRRFHPGKRDASVAQALKAGQSERPTLFFPHRFMQEKGLRTLLKAYPLICGELGVEPALVFAGTGPDLDRVKEAAERWEHIQYIGFLKDPEEMARWYASCDYGLALSGHETFGLSILEAMASGQVLVGANTGAAGEHVTESGAGLPVPLGDVRVLARTFCELVKKDREPLSLKARKYASRFTWQACFERELELYRRIAGDTE